MVEVVIKIPDELYKKLKTPKTVGLSEAFDQRAILVRAIQNGTVLPKGHGRLIDASVLKDKVASWLKPEKSDETEMISLDNALVSTIIEIEEAETIIEADKG